MSHDIKKMLRIIDENLEIVSVNQQLHKKKQTLVIHAVLSPTPTPCSCCGSTVKDAEGKTIVVKNGTKTVTVRFENYQHLPTIMILKKQKYYCRNCHSYSTAQTYFVKKDCFIAEHIKFKIIDLLKEKVSCRFISQLCNVSITTVIRVLQSLEAYIPADQPEAKLPTVLMVDEFRSHAPYEDKMSFICADGETGELIDILPSRKEHYLETHFQRHYPRQLDQVKFIVTDMNAPYFKLAKSCFKHSKIIIDRFHVVSHINVAFNEFRRRKMKQLLKNKKTPEANKLKSNWKLLLKNRQTIDSSTYSTWRSFRRPAYPMLTESMVIDRLLSYSDALKATYDAFHNLQDAFREKKPEEFFQILETLPDQIDEEFKLKVQNLLKYEEGIRNALIYPYSNGKLEAKNTHIKTIKRVSYGFKSFRNMRIRIFMINGLIQIK